MASSRALASAAVVALLALVVYGASDAFDILPGRITLASPGPTVQPYPTVTAVAGAPAAATLLPTPAQDAPVPVTDAIAALAQSTLTPDAVGASLGVAVMDMSTGKLLYSSQGSEPSVPASTMKLLTATAAADVLGPDKVLPTTVVAGAQGHVVLVGGGDAMLAAGSGNPSAINGHAGLGDLAAATARELKKQGTTSVTVDLDDTLFTGPAIRDDWTGSIAIGVIAPISPLAVNMGNTGAGPDGPRFDDPAAAARDVFVASLQAQGITATAGGRTKAASDAAPLASVDSAPMRDILTYFLQHSDNTIAETVGRLVAIEMGEPGSFDGSVKAVQRALHDLGLDMSPVSMVDCSGMSHSNRVSPVFLASLVARLDDKDVPHLADVLRSVPVGGLTGTLDERYVGGAGAGLVRAKTGSLYGVRALAGTVQDADGRDLAFAVIARALGDRAGDGVTSAFDAFVDGLAGCGCHG